jgi:hypothetical protein
VTGEPGHQQPERYRAEEVTDDGGEKERHGGPAPRLFPRPLPNPPPRAREGRGGGEAGG